MKSSLYFFAPMKIDNFVVASGVGSIKIELKSSTNVEGPRSHSKNLN